jgi:hypothetical protein
VPMLNGSTDDENVCEKGDDGDDQSAEDVAAQGVASRGGEGRRVRTPRRWASGRLELDGTKGQCLQFLGSKRHLLRSVKKTPLHSLSQQSILGKLVINSRQWTSSLAAGRGGR